tara:strand:- start:42 stop:269 length:228 start_codon:yes stop_codon:yes gene_type:complete
MIILDADKIKPNPIVQKTKDEVKKLVQRLNYSDALAALEAICKIHNGRQDVGGTESHNSVPAMDHDQILKDLNNA